MIKKKEERLESTRRDIYIYIFIKSQIKSQREKIFFGTKEILTLLRVFIFHPKFNFFVPKEIFRSNFHLHILSTQD